MEHRHFFARNADVTCRSSFSELMHEGALKERSWYFSVGTLGSLMILPLRVTNSSCRVHYICKHDLRKFDQYTHVVKGSIPISVLHSLSFVEFNSIVLKTPKRSPSRSFVSELLHVCVFFPTSLCASFNTSVSYAFTLVPTILLRAQTGLASFHSSLHHYMTCSC